MVALAIALGTAIVGQVGLVAYLVHAFIGAQDERDNAVKLYRDQLGISEQHAEERNEARAAVAVLESERAALRDRLAGLAATVRDSNERMARAVRERIEAGDAGGAAAAVDELLAEPLPGLPDATAPSGGAAKPAV